MKNDKENRNRLAAVETAALKLFCGDQEAVSQWLNTVLGLGNKRPVDMLETKEDTQTVLDLVGRLEHSVFS